MTHDATFLQLHAPVTRWARYFDTQLPAAFSSVEQECAALVRTCGFIDLSFVGKLTVAGSDARSFLHRMLSNDIEHLNAGEGCQAALLTPKAHIVSVMLVLACPDQFFLDMSGAPVAPLQHTLEQYVIADDVVISDATRAWAQFAVEGPLADTILSEILQMQLEAFGAPLAHQETQLRGHSVRVLRHSVTGCPGYTIITPHEVAHQVSQVLHKAVVSSGGLPIGMDAVNRFRIAAGIPWPGYELTGNVLLPETGLTDAVSYTKGCFIGQEVIARLDSRGTLSRRLAGLVVSGHQLPSREAVVTRQGQHVGFVTSAAPSPDGEKTLALAYVGRQVTAEERVEVLWGEKKAAAVTRQLPFA